MNTTTLSVVSSLTVASSAAVASPVSTPNASLSRAVLLRERFALLHARIARSAQAVGDSAMASAHMQEAVKVWRAARELARPQQAQVTGINLSAHA